MRLRDLAWGCAVALGMLVGFMGLAWSAVRWFHLRPEPPR
jgi:hypothetical protein